MSQVLKACTKQAESISRRIRELEDGELNPRAEDVLCDVRDALYLVSELLSTYNVVESLLYELDEAQGG